MKGQGTNMNNTSMCSSDRRAHCNFFLPYPSQFSPIHASLELRVNRKRVNYAYEYRSTTHHRREKADFSWWGIARVYKNWDIYGWKCTFLFFLVLLLRRDIDLNRQETWRSKLPYSLGLELLVLGHAHLLLSLHDVAELVAPQTFLFNSISIFYDQ